MLGIRGLMFVIIALVCLAAGCGTGRYSVHPYQYYLDMEHHTLVQGCVEGDAGCDPAAWYIRGRPAEQFWKVTKVDKPSLAQRMESSNCTTAECIVRTHESFNIIGDGPHCEAVRNHDPTTKHCEGPFYFRRTH